MGFFNCSNRSHYCTTEDKLDDKTLSPAHNLCQSTLEHNRYTNIHWVLLAALVKSSNLSLGTYKLTKLT